MPFKFIGLHASYTDELSEFDIVWHGRVILFKTHRDGDGLLPSIV